MRVLFFSFSVLLFVIVQQQSVEAKPFIFKFFVPQAPARTDSSPTSSSSPAITTGVDFTSILSTKLNLLTNLLRTGISCGFNFGFKKFLHNTELNSTRKPLTSTTATTPEVQFKVESSTKSNLESTITTEKPATTISPPTTTTTVESKIDKMTGSDNLNEPIDNQNKNIVTDTKMMNNQKTENGGSDNSDIKITTEQIQTNENGQVTAKETKTASNKNENLNVGYSYTTSGVESFSSSSPSNSNSQIDNNYENPNHAMSENEISNEIMSPNYNYLPTF